MSEKYGFVYIWYDHKRKMYYIGSHWGTEDDGYICSSNRMRDAYRKRRQDFKRRILSRIYSDRLSLLDEEQRWLDRVKRKDQYYNIHWKVRDNSWRDDPNRNLAVRQKISKAKKGTLPTEDHRKKNSEKIAALWKDPAWVESRNIESSSVKMKDKWNDPQWREQQILKQKEGLQKIERKTYCFVDPDGNHITSDNIKQFCDTYDLKKSSIYNLISGTINTHKGFKLADLLV